MSPRNSVSRATRRPLAEMRHFLAAVILAAGTLGVASMRAGAAAPTPLARLEQTTEQVRHLTPLHSVAAAFLPDAPFNTVVQANMRKGETDVQVEIGRRELVLLGLLSASADYHKILYQNVTSQVLGLYDYYAKKLYVRNESGKVFGVDRYAIAHEYTHALQDQHYNLKKLMPDESALAYRNSDAEGAHHALIEGDAVNTQYLYISKAYTPKEIHDLVNEPVPRVQPLPKALQRQFDFPYTAGLQFAQKLYKSGGMTGVDAAFHRLPNSTFDIMHPSAYLRHWKPVNVSLHGVRGFTDWKQVDDDVNGAFGIDIILWQYVSKSLADHVTNAYRGDRYIFLENGTQDAMLLKSAWTSPKSAAAAKAAWVQTVRAQLPNAHVSGKGATTLVQGNMSVYLHVSKSSLKVAYAPTAALAQQLGTLPTS
jgi:hypothetical protein